jgi:hypothetical protein
LLLERSHQWIGQGEHRLLDRQLQVAMAGRDSGGCAGNSATAWAAVCKPLVVTVWARPA